MSTNRNIAAMILAITSMGDVASAPKVRDFAAISDATATDLLAVGAIVSAAASLYLNDKKVHNEMKADIAELREAVAAQRQRIVELDNKSVIHDVALKNLISDLNASLRDVQKQLLDRIAINNDDHAKLKHEFGKAEADIKRRFDEYLLKEEANRLYTQFANFVVQEKDNTNKDKRLTLIRKA